MSLSHGSYILERDGRHSYHSYLPLPLQVVKEPEMDSVVSAQLIKAHRLLGTLDGMYRYIPDMNILAHSLAYSEAGFSWGIEKQEALYNERYGAEPLKSSGDKIIPSYASVLLQNAEPASKGNILLRVLQNAHHQMFSGDYDDAGQFRTMQLFSYPQITVQGAQIYNPPNPDDLRIAVKALEGFIKSPCKFDPLVKIALIYYQLSIVRPFSVGNGLLERMCVNLLLAQLGLMSHPLLCLSENLFVGDAEFRDALRLVRDYDHGYEAWVKFFLKVVISSAEKTIELLDAIYNLRTSDSEKLHSYDKCSPLLLAFYDYLWKSPIIEARDMISTLGVSYNTIAKAINTLRSLNILEQTDSKTRYRKFGYKILIEVLNCKYHF